MNRTYFEYLDVVKGIAIVMVVMGHLTLDIIREPIFNIIDSVHMPAFVLVSGYLASRGLLGLREGGQHDYKNYWRKKAIQLLLPLVLLPLAYVKFFDFEIESLVFDTYHAGYWFTLCLFELFVMLYLSIYLSIADIQEASALGRGYVRADSGIWFNTIIRRTDAWDGKL